MVSARCVEFVLVGRKAAHCCIISSTTALKQISHQLSLMSQGGKKNKKLISSFPKFSSFTVAVASSLSGRYTHCVTAVCLFDICLVFSRAVCGLRAAPDPGVALGGLEVVWGFKSAGTHCDATCGFGGALCQTGYSCCRQQNQRSWCCRVYSQTDEESEESDSTLSRLGTNRNLKTHAGCSRS